MAAALMCAVIGLSVGYVESSATATSAIASGGGSAGSLGPGGGGSNARSGPAEGGAVGTVSSVSTSGVH
jgi:hypothetical protein